ncbi:site-specific integrase [Winogradskyella bathintestinalis]|uniref:Site-specific integrase n=1 Tax=Winogradskyella bathintestinalis TaxID=3035208 RepID=A0ABT7ZQL0_9FLAO|nr:site-specific integrase [Winogradskyella bathintestinalis]MDN3491285.1 site-specific integrase [Winogradskyella bathintestinalis]
MQINRVTILFVIYKSRKKKDNTSPLYCRITYKKQRKEFATGYYIYPENWDSKNQLVKPPEKEHNFLNTQLSLIISQINQAFLMLQVNQVSFDVEDIFRQYKGETVKTDVGVVEVYGLFLQYLERLVGKELNNDTHKKYIAYGKHLKSFIRWKYKTKDIKLSTVKSSFIDHYEYYLKTEKNFAQITLNKVIQRFRRSIKYAIAEDYLDKDPFMLYKARRIKKEIVYLSQEELLRLENKTFEIKRLQQIKDMFVFCCYTGLAFKEMIALKKSDIIVEFDGNLWLVVHRVKTSRSYKVPLMPQAKLIMEKYHQEELDFVFPRISNPKFNAYLKEIADVTGIKINLTHHIARKTFATTVLLYNDVPMEIVSKLLGHAKMQTTQEHYGQIVERKISEEMIKLNKKFNT